MTVSRCIGLSSKEPNDLAVLTQVTIEVSNRRRRATRSSFSESAVWKQGYRLIEAGKKPDTFDDAKWRSIKLDGCRLSINRSACFVMTGNKLMREQAG